MKKFKIGDKVIILESPYNFSFMEPGQMWTIVGFNSKGLEYTYALSNPSIYADPPSGMKPEKGKLGWWVHKTQIKKSNSTLVKNKLGLK
jgi:hypothetical protein